MLRRINLIKALAAVYCLIILAAIWLYPLTSAAQTVTVTENPNVAQEVLLLIVKAVFSILAMITTYLVTKAIGYFEKKTSVDIPATAEALMHEWADKGIGLAFERAHQFSQETGKRLKGSDKLEIALKFVWGMAEQYDLPKMGEDKLKDYIEGKLGLKRRDAGVTLEDADVANNVPGNG